MIESGILPEPLSFPVQSMIVGMMPNLNNDLFQLRAEIALVAARMVAQDGADIDTARRKAARQVLGVNPPVPNMMPDDLQIEDAVRKYVDLFGGPAHGARLAHLRTTALQVMDALADFNPYITGPVLQGTAGEYDDIHLQLFADSAKEVQIYLLNRNVNIEISETPHFKGGRHAMVETVSFPWMKETVHAQLFEYQDLRGALKPRADGRPQRLDADGLRALVAADSTLEQDE